jgi:hypothetical protein
MAAPPITREVTVRDLTPTDMPTIADFFVSAMATDAFFAFLRLWFGGRGK